MDDDEEIGAELRRGVTRLYSRFRSERLEGEVPDSALLVLLALDKQGAMSLTALAEAAHVTLGSMSQTVRRVEEIGYIAKSRDTADRRRVLFSLTDLGREAVSASRRHRRDWLNSRVAELTADERDAIAAAAPILIRLADS
ncbi:hypothetical protein GCM10027568_06110 [Humibacter soli]